jgi:GNAT superfamily N-acetyltransferase
MSRVEISVAHPTEHAQLDDLYRVWGYHAGIAGADKVYVAQVDGRVVGLVRRTLEGTTTMLRGMQVDPAYQRRGIGKRLLTALVADLDDVECFSIPFAHLTSFYGQAGFVVAHEPIPAFLVQWLHRYRDEGHDVLVMRRPPPF